MLVLMMNVREVRMFMRQFIVAMPMLVRFNAIPGEIVRVLMVHVMHMPV